MITALLVDDEPRALDRLAEMLGDFEAVDVIGRAQSVTEAERFLGGRIPDVVFLDITMPERLGIDLLATVPPETKVVFVTARESYAIDAFRAGAVDYILKPYDRDRLRITIDRLEKMFADHDPSVSADQDLPASADTGSARKASDRDHDQTAQLMMARGGQIVAVPHADICWIEAVQNYSRVQMAGQAPAILRRTMSEWEAQLPAQKFTRISRSLVVQTTKILSTQWQSRDQMLVFFAGLGEPLPIGRTSMARLKDLLKGD